MITHAQPTKAVVLLLCLSGATLNAREFIESYVQLKNYVEQCVANLFYPQHDAAEILALQKDITNKIHDNYNVGFFFYDRYDQQRVYQIVIDESVNWVADKAYALKGERGREYIRQELIDKVSRMSEIPVGFMNAYMGQSLKEKLSHVGTQIPKPAKLYPSTECCICYQEFDGSVEQLFLVPCGHDLCKHCCKAHFFDHSNKYCPKCRATINISALRETLFPSSAPALDYFQ